MKRYWCTAYHMRDTLPETMAAVVGSDYDGQFSLENFDSYEGLDSAIVLNLEEVVREVFGERFKAILVYHKDKALRVYVHTARRDSSKASLGVDFHVEYTGLFDFLKRDYNSTTSMLSHVFSQILNKMQGRLAVQYPGVKVCMTHRYAHNHKLSLQFEVIVEPCLPHQEAA